MSSNRRQGTALATQKQEIGEPLVTGAVASMAKLSCRSTLVKLITKHGKYYRPPIPIS